MQMRHMVVTKTAASALHSTQLTYYLYLQYRVTDALITAATYEAKNAANGPNRGVKFLPTGGKSNLARLNSHHRMQSMAHAFSRLGSAFSGSSASSYNSGDTDQDIFAAGRWPPVMHTALLSTVMPVIHCNVSVTELVSHLCPTRACMSPKPQQDTPLCFTCCANYSLDLHISLAFVLVCLFWSALAFTTGLRVSFNLIVLLQGSASSWS